MRTRKRTWAILAILVAAGLICYFTRSREPEYQERKLSAWLEDLADLARRRPAIQEGAEQSVVRNWQRQQEDAAMAVRSIGARAVPYLIKLLHSSKSSAFRDKIEALLQRQSIVQIRLPERRDLSDLAIAGFEALGPAAAAAVPELSKLLLDSDLSGDAAACLRGIGAPALPILAGALTNTNTLVQWVVLLRLSDDTGPKLGSQLLPILLNAITNGQCRFPAEALVRVGDLGVEAHDALPWLQTFMLDDENPLAGPAMGVFADIGSAPEQWLGLFTERAVKPKFSKDAAFALARIGPSGVPALLHLLTNRDLTTQNAAMAALSPEVLKLKAGAGANSPGQRFSQSSAIYESRFQRLNSIRGPSWRGAQQVHSLANYLARFLEHSDAAVRPQIVEVLARYGYHSAAALSRAAKDQDEAVRSAARAALASLDVEVQDGAIVRGPKDQKRVALVFQGDGQNEGGEQILEELVRHEARASFFFTPEIENRRFASRVCRNGSYLGPHLAERLFYTEPEAPLEKSFLTDEFFEGHFSRSVQAIRAIQIIERLGTGVPEDTPPHYFVSQQGLHNLQMVEWAGDFGYVTVSPTPVEVSPMPEMPGGTESWERIYENVVVRDQQDPHRLNGCILLFHLASDPGQAARFHTHLVTLLDYLTGQGYDLVRIDELLEKQSVDPSKRYANQK